MTTNPRLTIRISAEDDEWLTAESDRLGCDKDNLVRMMIRQARNCSIVPAIRQLVASPAQSRVVPSYLDDRPNPLIRPAVPHDDSYVGPGADLGAFQASPAADIDPTDILATRLAEAGVVHGQPQHMDDEPPMQTNGVAVSMRHVEREKYNPGYGR